MSRDFYTAIEQRRSYYALTNQSTISDQRIQEIIEHAVKHTPTAFNSQSGRIVLLLNQHHQKLWDITMEELRKIVPAESFPPTEEKIKFFKGAYGTVLFFEDQYVIKDLQEKFSLYKEKFPVYSDHSSGMLQLVIWTALELEGLGASLQHYNPLIDNEIKREWNIPENWVLVAQMPFGKPTGEPGSKEFLPLEDRIKVIK